MGIVSISSPSKGKKTNFNKTISAYLWCYCLFACILLLGSYYRMAVCDSGEEKT